jgi:hypothetical protein
MSLSMVQGSATRFQACLVEGPSSGAERGKSRRRELPPRFGGRDTTT